MPSITIIDQPATYMPVYNQIAWTVNSTFKTQCNYKYVCDVYVNGSFVVRLKLFPAGANGYATFKVNRVLEDFISHDLQNNLFGFGTNPNSICTYQLKFGDEYDSSVGCTTGNLIYPNELTSSVSYAFNAAVQYKDWPTWSYTNYSTFVAADKKWLSNVPEDVMIGFGDQFVLNYMALDTNKYAYCVVVSYDEGNNIINAGYFANPNVTINSVAKRIQSVGVGPNNINNVTTLASGSWPLVPPQTHHYEIYLADTSVNPTSKTFTFTIDNRVSKWDSNRIWWLNRLGGFDSYAYTLKDRKVINSKRTEMTRLIGSLNSTPDWTYTIGDRGRTTLSVDAQQTNTYTSDWLTECEAEWQEELFTSPEVYMSKVNKKINFTNMAQGANYCTDCA